MRSYVAVAAAAIAVAVAVAVAVGLVNSQTGAIHFIIIEVPFL